MRDNFWKKSREYRLGENFFCADSMNSLWRTMTRGDGGFSMGNSDGEIAVLVHGLFHRAAVMHNFARFMADHGYRAICYDYATTRGDYFHHAARFKRFLQRLLRDNPGSRINIVTHSMGGILTRLALADKTDPLPPERFNRIVMLAPPHRGSPQARRYTDLMPALTGMLVRPLRDLSDAPESSIHLLPWPEGYTVGVIAGTYDKSVKLDSAPFEGQSEFLELPCGHSFMMFNPEVHAETLHFLKNGCFRPRAEAEAAGVTGAD
ncbi:MAG: esterase/lipase family protein [Victivallaceae bacterium]|nr:alpha/beta fold hydrolase [Victivallaceae bacterium]